MHTHCILLYLVLVPLLLRLLVLSSVRKLLSNYPSMTDLKQVPFGSSCVVDFTLEPPYTIHGTLQLCPEMGYKLPPPQEVWLDTLAHGCIRG